MYPPNAAGFYDTYGNVWEWVEDQFNGLPGFKTNYLYDDFSSPCFDGLHTMMLVSAGMLACSTHASPLSSSYVGWIMDIYWR